jgi:signal peptidase II
MAGIPIAMSPSSPAAKPAVSAAELPLAPPQAAACAPGTACAGDVPSCAVTRTLLLLVWVAVLLAVDQASKVYAMQHWKPTAVTPISYAGGVFRIQYAENPGAFLGLFGGLDPALRFWMLTAINGVILGAVGVCLLIGKPHDLWSWTALALILAGGIGNLIDRIRFDNHVVDFLILSTGPLDVPFFGEVRTGIFNVADIAITAGFLMLLPGVFWPGTKAEAK